MMCAATLAHAAAGERPRGPNCDLSKPPAGSGESFSHGVTLFVYPRLGDLGKTYTGCQTMLAPAREGWAPVMISEYVDGDPVRLWAPAPHGQRLAGCRYAKGVLVAGSQETCPTPMALYFASFPPGCVEKLKQAASKSAKPPGCELEQVWRSRR